MWIPLFFLQGLVILARGDDDINDDCINDLLKCGAYQISLTQRTFSGILIENPAELKRKCRGLEVYIECIDKAALKCRQGNLTTVQEAFIETRELAKKLCTTDYLYQQDFLKSAACINRQRAWAEFKCNPEEIYEKWRIRPSVHNGCQYQTKLLKCRQGTISENCGPNVGDLYRVVMTLELQLDHLCIAKKYEQNFSLYVMNAINSCIGMMLDYIKPILHLETSFVKAKQALNKSPSIAKMLSAQSRTRKLNDVASETCGGENDCPPLGEEPKERHSELLNNLRRFGDMQMPITDSDLSKVELESAIALKFYGVVLGELASMLTPENPKQKPVQRRSMDVDEDCNEECKTSKLTTFETQRILSETDVEENDAFVDDPKINSEVKMDWGMLNDGDPLELDWDDSHKEKEVNYVLVGEPYLPLEIGYNFRDQDYTYHADVKLSNKRYYMTPSTVTIPSMSSVTDISEPLQVLTSGVTTDECDTTVKKEHTLSSADKSKNDIPDDYSCRIESSLTPLEILPQIPEEEIRKFVQIWMWLSELAEAKKKENDLREKLVLAFC